MNVIYIVTNKRVVVSDAMILAIDTSVCATNLPVAAADSDLKHPGDGHRNRAFGFSHLIFVLC